jgi:hypothetical protein
MKKLTGGAATIQVKRSPRMFMTFTRNSTAQGQKSDMIYYKQLTVAVSHQTSTHFLLIESSCLNCIQSNCVPVTPQSMFREEITASIQWLRGARIRRSSFIKSKEERLDSGLEGISKKRLWLSSILSNRNVPNIEDLQNSNVKLEVLLLLLL